MYRRADPTFTNFKPTTAYEAVDRFTRCQRNGLKALMIPECLIECSRKLPPGELDKFEEWIINPNGLDFSKVVPDDRIQRDNEIMYLRNKQEREHTPLPVLPPLPPVDADEKFDSLESFARSESLQMDIDEEKYEPMKVQALGNGDVIFSNVSSKFAAMAVCGMDALGGLVPPT